MALATERIVKFSFDVKNKHLLCDLAVNVKKLSNIASNMVLVSTSLSYSTVL